MRVEGRGREKERERDRERERERERASIKIQNTIEAIPLACVQEVDVLYANLQTYQSQNDGCSQRDQSTANLSKKLSETAGRKEFKHKFHVNVMCYVVLVEHRKSIIFVPTDLKDFNTPSLRSFRLMN
jgi:hypothetical protein